MTEADSLLVNAVTIQGSWWRVASGSLDFGVGKRRVTVTNEETAKLFVGWPFDREHGGLCSEGTWSSIEPKNLTKVNSQGRWQVTSAKNDRARDDTDHTEPHKDHIVA